MIKQLEAERDKLIAQRAEVEKAIGAVQVKIERHLQEAQGRSNDGVLEENSAQKWAKQHKALIPEKTIPEEWRRF